MNINISAARTLPYAAAQREYGSQSLRSEGQYISVIASEARQSDLALILSSWFASRRCFGSLSMTNFRSYPFCSKNRRTSFVVGMAAWAQRLARVVILRRFCERSSSCKSPGEDSYSMLLRSASTHAVTAFRMTILFFGHCDLYSRHSGFDHFSLSS